MFQNVLVPVDLSDEHSWRKALPTATRLCQAFQARLHLITVVPEFGLPMVGQYFPEGYEAKLRQQAAKQLETLAAARVPNEVPTQCIVAEGKIYREILKAAKTTQADLIGPNEAVAVLGARTELRVPENAAGQVEKLLAIEGERVINRQPLLRIRVPTAAPPGPRGLEEPTAVPFVEELPNVS